MKYIVSVHGTLKADPQELKKIHDSDAAEAEPIAKALGNVSHNPYLNPQNPREFFDIDVWDNMEGLQKFFNDPVMGEKFAKLFESRPEVSIYEDKGWYHW